MSEEIDVVALKKRLPDMRGCHLWVLLTHFGVPSGHGVYYGKYYGYETYRWRVRGGEIEYVFDINNICVGEDIFDIIAK